LRGLLLDKKVMINDAMSVGLVMAVAGMEGTFDTKEENYEPTNDADLLEVEQSSSMALF
jgi:hypothetical protein